MIRPGTTRAPRESPTDDNGSTVLDGVRIDAAGERQAIGTSDGRTGRAIGSKPIPEGPGSPVRSETAPLGASRASVGARVACALDLTPGGEPIVTVRADVGPGPGADPQVPDERPERARREDLPTVPTGRGAAGPDLVDGR